MSEAVRRDGGRDRGRNGPELTARSAPAGRAGMAMAIVVSASMGMIAVTGACGGGGAASGSTSGGAVTSSGAGGGSMGLTWEMGAPLSTATPPFMATKHPLTPTLLWGTEKAPRPTNAEWMNLVLGEGKSPINLLPYVVHATDSGFEVSVPKLSVSVKSVTSAAEHDLSFRSTAAIGSRALTGYDLLSVTMQWSESAGGTLTAPLVRGMPYATALYSKLTPFIGTSHAILKVNGDTKSPVTADRFIVELNNAQTWALYTSTKVTFQWNATGLTASAPLDGFLRAAVLGPASDALEVLDAHRGAYPSGGEVTAKVTGDEATIGFQWKKQGGGPLLMMALPHHLAALDLKTTDVTLSTIKGDMTAIAADAWSLRQKLGAIGWSAPAGIASDRAPDIKAALDEDSKVVPDAMDPYVFGKQVARLGRLALIADELQETKIAAAIRAQIKASLDPWLLGTNPDALRYESIWGGICTTQGLASATADLGQGYYNDHHFQYGYLLYAAAVVAKADKSWLAARKESIYALARDIGNPSKGDNAFARFRHMDWFTGHSWAAGLFESGDSRNQESSSEAVNAWYGMYLLGLAAEDLNLTNVGRVLLATEIRGAQTYWHIRKGSSIYKAPFAFDGSQGNTVVGVLWSTKVDYATFFCAADACVHGIQMLPFTPISEQLLEKAWVNDEYPNVASKLTDKSDEGWKGFIYMDHAILDAKAAWSEVSGLKSFDNGNSRTNALYWVATRP
jgi:endo-1,3(4)-beta-glucanase